MFIASVLFSNAAFKIFDEVKVYRTKCAGFLDHPVYEIAESSDDEVKHTVWPSSRADDKDRLLRFVNTRVRFVADH